MKEINELIEKRNALIAEISKVDVTTEDGQKRFNELEPEIERINKEINARKKQEELNKQLAESMKNHNDEGEKREGRGLGRAVIEYVRDGNISDDLHKSNRGIYLPESIFRADPILTSTDTGLINVAPGDLLIVKSPGQQLINDLGVTVFSGLVGNVPISGMGESTAGSVSEDASSGSADQSPSSKTLAAVRHTHYNSYTKEFLAQTSSSIYSKMIQDLVDGCWLKIATNLFVNIKADAALAASGIVGSTLAFTDIVNVEASVGDAILSQGAYVTTPATKAFMKRTAALTNQNAIWVGNEVNGYPAFSSSKVQSAHLYFGDFSKAVLGLWGGIEMIVDPYSERRKSRTIVQTEMLADSVAPNYRAFTFIADVSI